MTAFRVLRLAALDIWEEAGLLLITGLLGGLLGILLLPAPFVLAAHYGTALRVSEGRAISMRSWLRDGRENAGFFYRWVFIVAVVAVVVLVSITFYSQSDEWWAQALRVFSASVLIVWLLPQPFAAAFYYQQVDRRVQVAVRNAALLALSEAPSVLLLWVVLVLVALGLGYVAWPLWLVMPVLLAVVSTRLVAHRLKSLRSGTARE